MYRISDSLTDGTSPTDPFWAFCRRLAPDRRIAVVKICEPMWSVRQIAEAVGMSERTVFRSLSYRRLREIDQARDITAAKRRGRHGSRIERPDKPGFSNPNDPKG
jgi:IS30 family transposase